MTDLKQRIDRLQYQLKLIIEGMDLSDNPMAVLTVELDWAEDELRKANDIFEVYDRQLELNQDVNWTAFEMELRKTFHIGYQTVKIVILAFYSNNQWVSVCYHYAKAKPCVEFHDILGDKRLGFTKQSLHELISKVFPIKSVGRDENQMTLVIDHLTSLDILPYTTIHEIEQVLLETKDPRHMLAQKYPTKSGLDELVRAMAIENSQYFPHAFPGKPSGFLELIGSMAKGETGDSGT